jgi:uncharacterized protein
MPEDGGPDLINSWETKPRNWADAYRSLRSGGLRRVFVGEQGLRVGWSVLLFAAIYFCLEAAPVAALGHFFRVDPKSAIPLSLALFGESAQILIVFIATLIMARIERRRFLSYGYTDNHKLVRLVSGIAWGFLCLSGLIGVLWKAGFLVFDGRALTGFTVWKFALGWGFVFLMVGFFEESLLRGYLQHKLSPAIGFWWAALLLSVAFLVGHAGNEGESSLGLLEVGVAGFYFCLSLRFTKSLWWAVGFHAGWDWAQSYFYGTPDSGLVIGSHLLTTHPSGNPLWSGGTAGPEGSILILPLVILMSTAMWLWWGVRKRGVS